jgi:hypothetical protein
MAEIVQGLFGVSPDIFRQQQDAQFRAQALAEAQLDPRQGMVYDAAIGGRQFGRAVNSLFGAEDPMLARQSAENNLLQQVQSSLSPADLQDPYKLSAAVYQAAMRANMPELANNAYQNMQKAQTQAISQGKDVALTTEAYAKATKAVREQLDPFARQLIDAGFTKGSPEYIQAMTDKIKKDTNIPDSVKRSTQAQMLLDAGLVEGSPEFQAKMKEFIQADITGKAKGNSVTIEGGSSTVDVARLSADFDRMVTPSREKLTSINDALDVAEVAKTSPQATVQVDKALAKLMDNGLVSNKDFKDIQNAGSLPSSLANRVSKIFNGTDATATYDDKVRVLQTFQTIAAKKNNDAVDRFTNVWGTSPMGKKTVEAITKGAKFNTGRTSPAKSTIPFVNSDEEIAFRAWQAKKRANQ